jgi:hypothetical protein
MLGTVGCSLMTMTVDPEVGDEVVALFRDDPGYAERYASVTPLTLVAHTGAVRTPFGAVAFVVWQIAAATPQEIYIETFLNPTTAGPLVATVSAQTHLKLIIVDNRSSAVTAFVDYGNDFGLGELLEVFANLDCPREASDFRLATDYVRSNIDIVGAIRDAAQRDG